MAIKRKIAFQNNGIYYAFNQTKTKLMGITSNPETWMDANILTDLTNEELKLVGGYTLEVYSPYDDDEYTVNVTSYDVVCTTDDTHISTKGYRGINKIAASGSGNCKLILSFDNRQSWYTYKEATWQQVKYNDIYSQGMSIDDINALISTDYDKIFKRGTLDLCIAISAGDYFNDLTVSLPQNSAPEILGITLGTTETHNKDIPLNVKVMDYEEDEMRYEIYLNDNDEPIMADDINPLSNGILNLTINNHDLKVGQNTLIFTVYDAKNASNSKTVYIYKNNQDPVGTITLIDNDQLYFTITDADDDKMRYRILLNDEEVVPFTDFIAGTITRHIALPRNKIIFGKKNTVVIEYEDDIREGTKLIAKADFTGYYYGVLFVDPRYSKDEINSDGSISNNRFFADSLGNYLRALEIPDIICGKQSATYEVGVVNLSNQKFVTTTIVPEQDDNSNIVFLMSATQAPFDAESSLTFRDIAQKESVKFYVRIKAKDNLGDCNIKLTATAKDN